MRAVAYQRFEPASGCIVGPAASSMINSGLASASRAKKKSGPRPAHDVPSCNSFSANDAVMASRSCGLAALANAISCVASSFSSAEALCGNARKQPTARSDAQNTGRNRAKAIEVHLQQAVRTLHPRNRENCCQIRRAKPASSSLHKCQFYGIIINGDSCASLAGTGCAPQFDLATSTQRKEVKTWPP